MADFDKATRPSSDEGDEWRLLVMDNFGSHLTLSMIDYAIEHHIEMVGYIPHSTHVLQGLDLVCFGAFKTLYGKARRNYEHGTGLEMSKEAFLEIVKEPFEQAFNSNNICTAFRITGVEPLDPKAIGPEKVAPSAARSATVSFPLPLPSPVRAVMPYFRALQKRKCTTRTPSTPELTPHKTCADIDHMTPNTRQQTLEARRRLEETSAGFLTRPTDEINSHCHMPEPLIIDPPVTVTTEELLSESLPTSLTEARLQNIRLRGALQESESRNDAYERIIEGQNVMIGLQAVGYEEQVRKAGEKEKRPHTNRDKLLVTKVGRHLTSAQFRDAVNQDNAERAAKKTKREEGKKNRDSRAALSRAKKTWRDAEKARRRAQREKDIRVWEAECQECRENGVRCPKKPRAPMREPTPETFKVASRKRAQSLDGEEEEDEWEDDDEGKDSALDNE